MLRKFAILSLLVLGVATAHADSMGDALNNQFNTMVNATPPGMYNTASRSVLSGGDLYVRTPDMTVHPLTVTAPSISMGCRGIDIRGGNLSFISEQQMIDMLRSIAAEAPTYAFEQALTGMCPQCMNIINKLQAIVQEVNGWSLNSCRAAQGLVNAPFSSQGGLSGFVSNQVYGPGGAQAAQDGQSSDYFTTALNGLNTSLSDVYSYLGGQSVRKTGALGNATHGVLAAAQDPFYATSFDPNFAQEVLSLVGTVVNETDGSGNPVTHTAGPTISLVDIVKGNPNATLYQCSDWTQANATVPQSNNTANQVVDCVDVNGTPQQVTGQNIPGMYTTIKKLMTNPTWTSDSSQPGIVELWASNLSETGPSGSQTMTQQQQNLVGMLGLGGALHALAKANPTGAQMFAQDLAMDAAIKLSYLNVQKVLQQVRDDASLGQVPDSSNALPMIKEALEQLNKDRDTLSMEYSATEHLSEEYLALAKITDINKVSRPPSSVTSAPGH